MNHCCKTCTFWHLFPIADGQHQCRRHAPVKSEQGIRYAFPLTRGHDWCGDWEKGSVTRPEPQEPQWPKCPECHALMSIRCQDPEEICFQCENDKCSSQMGLGGYVLSMEKR